MYVKKRREDVIRIISESTHYTVIDDDYEPNFSPGCTYFLKEICVQKLDTAEEGTYMVLTEEGVKVLFYGYRDGGILYMAHLNKHSACLPYSIRSLFYVLVCVSPDTNLPTVTNCIKI